MVNDQEDLARGRTPNAETRAAMRDADQIAAARGMLAADGDGATVRRPGVPSPGHVFHGTSPRTPEREPVNLHELIEDRQIEMFGEAPPAPPDLVPSEDEIRATLTERLAFVASVQEMPWKPERVRHHRTVFAQMCNWLPKEEATRMREAFDGHVDRLTLGRSARL